MRPLQPLPSHELPTRPLTLSEAWAAWRHLHRERSQRPVTRTAGEPQLWRARPRLRSLPEVE